MTCLDLSRLVFLISVSSQQQLLPRPGLAGFSDSNFQIPDLVQSTPTLLLLLLLLLLRTSSVLGGYSPYRPMGGVDRLSDKLIF